MEVRDMYSVQMVPDAQSRVPLMHDDAVRNNSIFKKVTLVAATGGVVGIAGAVSVAANVVLHRYGFESDGVVLISSYGVALASSVGLFGLSVWQLWVKTKIQKEFSIELCNTHKAIYNQLELIQKKLQQLQQEGDTVFVNRKKNDCEEGSLEQINGLLDEIHNSMNGIGKCLDKMKSRLSSSLGIVKERRELKEMIDRLNTLSSTLRAKGEAPLLRQLHTVIEEIWWIMNNNSIEGSSMSNTSNQVTPQQLDIAVNILDTFNFTGNFKQYH
jgi:hypothetical protein